MTEEQFLKIADAKTALKGSFKGIIIKASDLKSGTKNGKDWTMKTFTIEDESGSADLVAWGEEVSQFKLGYKYEIVNPFWKTYVNKQNVSQITVQVGNYGKATVIGSTNTEASSTKLPETPEPPKEQTITPPVTPPVTTSTKCIHGIAASTGMICKKCVATMILGYVQELENVKIELEK